MRILLSNDDGIFAPGLLAMYSALAKSATVDVVAPDSVQSGGSHAITVRHPVLWRSVQVGNEFHGTSVEGTPADCVKLAINALLPEKPDLVVSGINAGLNTGIHALYSGTIAAAVEGAIWGCPGVAVSFELYRDMEYDKAADVAVKLIDRIMQNGLTPGQLFSINIPQFKPGWPRGVKVAPQSTLPMMERIERRTDPMGRTYYWLSGDFHDIGDELDTDRYALKEGYVCVTPLQFNLTEMQQLAKMQDWIWPDLTTHLNT